jgi:hypothetical protein
VAEFQRGVEQRSSHIHFVDEGSHDRELSITLGKDGDFTTGELRLIERDGSLRQRSVRFTTCAEAVQGLALITAVSLDPQSLLEPAPADSSPPKPAVAPKPAAPPPVIPAAKLAPLPKERAARLEASVGAAFSAAFQALPATALGGTLFVDVASASTLGFAPLVRLSLNHVERRGLAEADSKANFALTLGTLSACPVRLRGGRFDVRPCAFAGGGVLRSWGSETDDPHVSTRPYAAWGGSLLFFARISQSVELIDDVALGTTLIRDQFAFGGAPFGRTLGLYISNDIGLRFVFR